MFTLSLNDFSVTYSASCSFTAPSNTSVKIQIPHCKEDNLAVFSRMFGDVPIFTNPIGKKPYRSA